MAKLDRVQAIAVVAWLAFGGAVLFFGWHLAMFNRRGGPGPGFFLKSLAWLLVLLALVRAVTLVREVWRRGAEPDHTENAAGGAFRAANVGRVLLLVLALTLYAYLLPKLGFLVATTALCWATLMLFGRHRLRSLVEAAAAAFFVHLCFTRGLGVPLPEAQLQLLRGLGL